MAGKPTTVPIDIVGGSYENVSRPFSAQVTRGLYPELNSTGRASTALQSFPGAKAFSAGSPGAGRGIYNFNGVLYSVSANKLYSIGSTGTQTAIGVINGTGSVIFSSDVHNMVINTNTDRYKYDGVTLTNITTADEFEPGNSSAYVNSQMVYDGIGGRFFVSDAGTTSDITAQNYATAEALADNTIRVYTFNEILYVFGERSVQPWWNSGVGSPPFDVIQNSTAFLGLAAVHSVANTRNWIYFLADDKNVWRLVNNTKENVTTPAMANIFEQITDVSGAKAFTFTLNMQEFYAITVNKRTHVFSETVNVWFELSYNNTKDEYIGNSFAMAYNKLLIGSRLSGDVYELDQDTFTDNSKPIIRERVLSPIDGIAIEKPGQRLLMTRFEVVCETGTGTPTGQGENPKMMFSFSYDGGKSYTNEVWIDMGRTGEITKVEVYNTRTAYSFVPKITVSDPVKLSIHSAAMDISEAGW